LEMDIPVGDRVAPKTADGLRKLFQGVFSYLVKEVEVLKDSPARDLDLKLDTSRTYSSCNTAETLLWVKAANDVDKPWQKWMLLLGLYTGARRGELVQLRGEDIKLDSDSGRHYILITDDAGSVKTSAAIRQVPIHQELINAGLLDLAAGVSGRLFPDLDAHQVTGWFTRYRENIGIPSRDDFGNRKVFHSFRHTVITKLRSVGVPVEKVQQVIGHEKTSAGVTDRYTHTFPLKDVLGVIDSLVYE